MAASGELAGLTVPQLKECLEALGLKKGGRKGDLIERIEAYFAENPG